MKYSILSCVLISLLLPFVSEDKVRKDSITLSKQEFSEISILLTLSRLIRLENLLRMGQLKISYIWSNIHQAYLYCSLCSLRKDSSIHNVNVCSSLCLPQLNTSQLLTWKALIKRDSECVITFKLLGSQKLFPVTPSALLTFMYSCSAMTKKKHYLVKLV